MPVLTKIDAYEGNEALSLSLSTNILDKSIPSISNHGYQPGTNSEEAPKLGFQLALNACAHRKCATLQIVYNYLNTKHSKQF